MLVSSLFLACSEPAETSTTKTPQPGLAMQIKAALAKLADIEEWRGQMVESHFYKDTVVVTEVRSMEVSIQGCRRNLQNLINYRNQALKQGLTDDEQAIYKEEALAILKQHLDHWDKGRGRFEKLSEPDYPVFFDTWSKMKRINADLSDFVAAGVPCHDEQRLMRDYATQLKDARRFWTQELVNGLRGAELDQKLLTISCGSVRHLAKELKPIFDRSIRGHIQLMRLTGSLTSLKQRLAWSRDLLTKKDLEASWVAEAKQTIAAVEKDIPALEKIVANATQLVLLPNDDSQRTVKREKIVKDINERLAQLNKVFVIKARTMGWELPTKKS